MFLKDSCCMNIIGNINYYLGKRAIIRIQIYGMIYGIYRMTGYRISPVNNVTKVV